MRNKLQQRSEITTFGREGGAALKRNTTQRTAIEKVFLDHKRPLSVDEILNYGRESVPSLNQATVYRNIKNLIDSGWLTRLSHPALGNLYERSGKEHHHHFHCRACNKAFELPGCALKLDKAAPEGFVVEDHDIFLFGVCPSCSDSEKKQK